MKKMNDKAQGSQLMLLMLLMFAMFFIFGNPGIMAWIQVSMDSIFYPFIGFNGNYPLLTIILAGVIVVFLSSCFTTMFTDFKAMGKAQKINKEYNKELNKARKEGNTNRVNKLMKMRPEIMKITTQSQSGMMKPMFFLFIFIAPIFIWLRYFLSGAQYILFTTPWADGVNAFGYAAIIMSNWILLYFVFSMTVGQLFRQGLKWLVWSDRWKNFRKTIRSTR